MQLQSKKNTLAVLLVGWLIVLGSYLIIRFVFILIGFTLNPTILGICLAVIPCLLETLYLGKCGKSQRISVYVLGLLIPSGNVKKCAVGKYPKSEKLGSAGQAACCACTHSRYFTGGSPSGLRV